MKNSPYHLAQMKKYSGISSYGDHKYHIFKVYEIIKKLNKTYNFKKSLDVGCNDGKFSSMLNKSFNIEPYGMDLIKESIEIAKKRGVIGVVSDAGKKFPYETETFDLIICCEIIEHMLDTDFFISELKRITKKDGIIIITTPNLCSLHNRLRMIIGKYPAHGPAYTSEKGHFLVYNFPTLINHLKKYNFKPIIKTTASFPFPMMNKNIPEIFKKIAMKAGDYFPTLGSHIIIAAKKLE